MSGCFTWYTIQRGLYNDYGGIMSCRTSSERGQDMVLTFTHCVPSSSINNTEHGFNLT